MKDYVFIGWSRNRDLAIEVKNILDTKGFVCVIGGVYEGNPADLRIRRGTVNETINYQMNHCDQSILLFQKINGNLGISGNLIYELGYISAQYNFIDTTPKLHIFKIDITQADDNLFPTDLHGIWGSSINSSGKSLQTIANEIANEFLNNQSQIKKENKFRLLNDHHFVEYEMQKHFERPSMSDYDLALHILVYLQSAFCYQEQNDMEIKLKQFKEKMIEKGSSSAELSLAIDYAILSMKLFCMATPGEENLQFGIEGSTFRKMLKEYKRIGERVAEGFKQEFGNAELDSLKLTKEFCDNNEFEALLIAQMQEHVTYLVLVYLFKCSLKAEEIEKNARLGIRYCLISIENLELLAEYEENKRYAYLLLCYAYKNLSTFSLQIGDTENGDKYQRKSFKLRRDLHAYVNGVSAIKPSLKDYVTLEYLVQAVEVIKTCEDEDEAEDYRLEIEEYIEKKQKWERNRQFMLNMLLDEYGNLD